MSRYAPVDPYMEQLGPYLERMNENGEPDPEGFTVMDGLLSLHQLFQGAQGPNPDPKQIEALEDWWDDIGSEFGFFDAPTGGEPPAAGAAAAPAAAAAAAPASMDLDNLDVNALGLDPAAATIVQGLVGTVKDMQAKLGEFETQGQQQRAEAAVTQESNRIYGELVEGMKTNRIAGFDQQDVLATQAGADILKLAASYGADPKAVEKGVADYMRINGHQAPPQPNPADPTVAQGGGVEALRAMLANGGNAPAAERTGHALGPGADAHEPEAVSSFRQAHEIALRRAHEPGAFG